ADRLIREALLTKSLEWQYEREHRIILPLDDQASYPNKISDARIHLFSFSSYAIAAIIVGARTTEETKRDIRAALSRESPLANVPLFQARTSDTKFAVTIEPDSHVRAAH